MGLVLGLVLAYMLTRFTRGLLYGVSATDPLTAACITAFSRVHLYFGVLPAGAQSNGTSIRSLRFVRNEKGSSKFLVRSGQG